MEGDDKRTVQPNFNKTRQKNAWPDIAITVNAAFPQTRCSAEDCQISWYNVLAAVHKRIAAYKKHTNHWYISF